jgi:putative ABC transport system permease protein
MNTAVKERPLVRGTASGGAPARRAMVRWAWRLFRREWRRQALVLALLTVAVAATTVGLAIVSNAVQLGADPTFGSANTIISLPGSDLGLTADIAAAQSQFGTIDVVSHQSIAVPGSVSSIDLRAANPDGPYVHVTMRLDTGRYPTGPNQVAVTSDVAKVFGLHIGSIWAEGARTLRVVGLVENPLNLLDQFGLLAPGQAGSSSSVSILVDTASQSVRPFHFPSGAGVSIDGRGTSNKTAAEALVLVLATIGLLFVGLLAVAGFAVMAQRRLRALGMLSSLGATDRHVRLVMLANGAAVGATAAAVGAAIGLAAWLAFAPSLQSVVAHRINRFNLPWWAIATALVLAVVTAIAAAWWPARAAARIPVVAALSGRPPRPQPAHRFAAAGGLLLGSGLVLLAFADQRRAPFIITGTVATVVGVLLLAPLAIQAVASMAGRAPIAVRLALRDLARYQARSGAALGAATLAVAIAATIAISAAAAQTPPAIGNLPANQLILYLGQGGFGPGNPVPPLTPAQQRDLQLRVDQLAGTLHAQTVLPIEAAYNPASPDQPFQPGPGGQSGGRITASLAHVRALDRGEEVNAVVELYVATPALLSHYGINPSQIDPAVAIITSRTDLGGLQVFLPDFGADSSGGPPAGQPQSRPTVPPEAAAPNIQVISQLPIYGSAPSTLLTSHGMQTLGLQATPASWLIQTPHPLTTAQIEAAQKMAASAGLSVETKSTQKSLAPLRNWSTAAGILVALGVLAMTAGLIRSETANDLRTLTATGASSTTRRTLTGATTGALGLLGALLGTAGAYAALLAWHRNDLHPLTRIPIINLVVIMAALPLVAGVAGWLLAGREPTGIARRPLE